MQERERFLPRKITRFNYWTFEIASPKPQYELMPTVQRLGEFPEEHWIDRPGHTAAHRHNQQTFHLMLNATPDIWAEKVFPVQHVELADIPNQPLFALEYYVENDKEWAQDPEAQQVLKQFLPEQRKAIRRMDTATWPTRSKRLARITRTWENLFCEIACDVDTFERFCDVPPAADEMSGTPKRIYLSYRNQAIKLLGGGGTYIPMARRGEWLVYDPLDESNDPKGVSALNIRGRIDIGSIYKDVDWLTLARQDRREAEKRTLHWFRHALRNLREYRNRRPKIPWTPECEQTCLDIQKKLRTAKS